MSIYVKDIIKVMEKVAPPSLKESYDNVGLMVGDKEKEVHKVLLALDCTKKVIEEAKRNNIDLIITHHPLIFRKPSRIVKDDLQGFKIIELIKNDISLFSSHTNLDSVKGGINEEIVNILGFKSNKIIEESRVLGFQTSGIGRIVELEEEKNPEDIIKIVKEKLNVENLKKNKKNSNYKWKRTRLFSRCIEAWSRLYYNRRYNISFCIRL